MHAETWKAKRKTGEDIANLFASICLLQMAGHRHWILENPVGSDLFKLKAWQELEPFAHKVVVHQCLLGLKDQEGRPVRKATTFGLQPGCSSTVLMAICVAANTKQWVALQEDKTDATI